MELWRVAAVADRLFILARDPNKIVDSDEFFNLCIVLARGIDYIVSNNENPERFEDLPAILKQVCKCKNDSVMGGIFALMLSVKYACRFGFFLAKDSEELLALTNEIESSYCVGDKFSSRNDTISNLTTIMSRFYPWLRMGQILTCIEVEKGYGLYVKDFFVQKNMHFPPTDQIRFLVARTDLMENSSCIINPPQVNFLLNGKGVDKRTTTTLDKGPQMPTIVTPMLSYGVNLLQAVGEFNGSYIIMVALMSPISSVAIPVQDYVPPVVTSHDSDPEIAEGASRISLNCPISFKRIKTPIKGQSCKHHQCFDFNNFVEINAKRPSWRCPYCSQDLFLSDIRVDQTMVKILKEVNESVTDVIISIDGSWKAVTENKDNADKLHSTNLNIQQDALMIDTPPDSDIIDLTEDNVDKLFSNACEEPQDVKPVLFDNQTQPCLISTTFYDDENSSSSHTDDDFWSGLYLPTFENLASDDPSSNFMSPPSFLSSTTLNGESTGNNFVPLQQQAVYGTRQPSRPDLAPPLNTSSLNLSQMQPQPSRPDLAAPLNTSSLNLSQLQPQQPSRPHLTPLNTSSLNMSSLQQQIPQLDQRNRSNQATTGHSSLSPRFNAQRVSAALSTGFENQQLHSTSHSSAPLLRSSNFQQRPISLAGSHQGRRVEFMQTPSSSRQSPSPPVWTSTQIPNNYYRGNNTGAIPPPPPPGMNTQLQNNNRGSNMTGIQPPPGMNTQLQNNNYRGSNMAGIQPPPGMNTQLQNNNYRGSNMAGIQPPSPPPGMNTQLQNNNYRGSNMAGIQPPSPPPGMNTQLQNNNRGSNIVGIQPTPPLPPASSVSEQEWRPTGRMRGSLSGQAYEDARMQFIVRPALMTTTTTTRPALMTTTTTTQTSSRTPQELSGNTTPLHLINARNRMAQVSQTVNLSATNGGNSSTFSNGSARNN
ncbi:E4 SUMO-protein ligase PIAL2-like isoform X3 [Impatiens glandulifera]|uniref:E4 SUMO-protein ligase PIAL2-like isoform X3 n=1 Tax=Impatiens glandulifera TaxID=253017 RepID=UPI001FB0B663|nr:E4 SUMO-protein ligase PIAL2-like isoform X3 [Impatiens glandulifera]